MKKFELTSEFIEFSGRKLFRIKALINFKDDKNNWYPVWPD